jgi:hypothetical protein
MKGMIVALAERHNCPVHRVQPADPHALFKRSKFGFPKLNTDPNRGDTRRKRPKVSLPALTILKDDA